MNKSVDELTKTLRENFEMIESNQNDHMKALVSIYSALVVVNRNLKMIQPDCDDLPTPKINMEDEDSNVVIIA